MAHNKTRPTQVSNVPANFIKQSPNSKPTTSTINPRQRHLKKLEERVVRMGHIVKISSEENYKNTPQLNQLNSGVLTLLVFVTQKYLVVSLFGMLPYLHFLRPLGCGICFRILYEMSDG